MHTHLTAWPDLWFSAWWFGDTLLSQYWHRSIFFSSCDCNLLRLNIRVESVFRYSLTEVGQTDIKWVHHCARNAHLSAHHQGCRGHFYTRLPLFCKPRKWLFLEIYSLCIVHHKAQDQWAAHTVCVLKGTSAWGWVQGLGFAPATFWSQVHFPNYQTPPVRAKLDWKHNLPGNTATPLSWCQNLTSWSQVCGGWSTIKDNQGCTFDLQPFR